MLKWRRATLVALLSSRTAGSRRPSEDDLPMWPRNRVVLQHDETDCGPAVLAMIMRHHKRPATMGRIRELAQTDAAGTSLYGLCAAAEALGFRATGFLAPYEDLASGRIACPVIAPVI